MRSARGAWTELERAARRLGGLALAVVGSAGCATAPVPSGSPAELEALRERVVSVPHDREAAIRGAAGLWSLGRREEALDLLTSALASSPEDGALHAVRGAAAEGLGRYVMARADYLDALRALRGAPPAEEVEVRLDDIGVAAADALARRIVVQGTLSEREETAGPSAGIFPLVPTADDQELEEIVHGLSELLARDLRGVGPFRMVDPALMSALRAMADESETATVSPATATSVARVLGLTRVMWGEVSPLEGGGLRVRLHVLGQDQYGTETVAEASIDIPDVELPATRRLLAGRLWELTVGAEEGAFEGGEDWPPVPVERLRALGRGVEAARRGDHRAAITEFSDAGGADESFDDARLLAARSSRLLMMRESRSLGFADQALTLVRADRTMRALAGERSSVDGERPPFVGEMFGQDRLGWHHLVDVKLDFGKPR